jgi:hypothetical protein
MSLSSALRTDAGVAKDSATNPTTKQKLKSLWLNPIKPLEQSDIFEEMGRGGDGEKYSQFPIPNSQFPIPYFPA